MRTHLPLLQTFLDGGLHCSVSAVSQQISLAYSANHDCNTGVACLMYGTMGIFGAARFGQATEGDCLVNTWLGGRREGWVDLAMALYLSISIPPMQVSQPLTPATLCHSSF